MKVLKDEVCYLAISGYAAGGGVEKKNIKSVISKLL